MRFMIFFTVLLSLLLAINGYVYKRTADAFAWSRRGRYSFALLLLAGLLATIGSRAIKSGLSPDLREALAVFGAAVQLGALVAFAILALESVVRRATMWFHGLVTRRVSSARRSAPGLSSESASGLESAPALGSEEVTGPSSKKPSNGASSPIEASASGLAEPAPRILAAPMLSKRVFLSRAVAGAAVGLGGGAGAYAALIGRHDYAIEEVPIRLANLPPALDGFTIVQLSDIHLGSFVNEWEVRTGIELVRRARPDLIVLTGDLIDHDHRYAPMLGSMVRRLRELAPVAAVAGNHDHYAGVATVLRHLREAGAEVLSNRGITIGKAGAQFALLGVDDVWATRFGGGPDLDAALSTVQADMARVLLCHNPSYFVEAAQRVDLQLSGHTHGGQFNPLIQPAKLVLPHGYVEGRYQRGASQIYVNRGFGTAGPPARLGAPPEVTKIVLTS